VLVLIAIPVWPLVSFLLDQRRSWSLTRRAGSLLARLSGVSISIAGTFVEGEDPYVVVANHASFIDGMVLILLLRGPVSIVAGGELAKQRLAGPFLRGLGCEFVGSGRARSGSSEAERLSRALRQGCSVAIFPEASLGRGAGLRRFHLGAFAMAVGTGTSVLPVGISGTRDIVRPGRHAPEPGRVVHARIGTPVSPTAEGLAGAIALRDKVREVILELSGEQDLLAGSS
jgi:1-acyl-sn-glycerol-3-phosphate acyltransferase